MATFTPQGVPTAGSPITFRPHVPQRNGVPVAIDTADKTAWQRLVSRLNPVYVTRGFAAASATFANLFGTHNAELWDGMAEHIATLQATVTRVNALQNAALRNVEVDLSEYRETYGEKLTALLAKDLKADVAKTAANMGEGVVITLSVIE